MYKIRLAIRGCSVRTEKSFTFLTIIWEYIQINIVYAEVCTIPVIHTIVLLIFASGKLN